ncbi:MAG TPA: hypothetical protein VGB71_10895 [Flavisolibacter sp.]|jgi:hypothetical protein
MNRILWVLPGIQKMKGLGSGYQSLNLTKDLKSFSPFSTSFALLVKFEYLQLTAQALD